MFEELLLPPGGSYGNEGFLSTYKTLCTGRKGPQVQAKALNLLQRVALSEAYKYTLPLLFETFEELVREGAVFPDIDESAPPLFLPEVETTSGANLSPADMLASEKSAGGTVITRQHLDKLGKI